MRFAAHAPMKQKGLGIAFLLICFLFVYRGLRAGEPCATCHEDQVKFTNMHGPAGAGECTACHTSHDSETKTELVEEGDQLCFTCHGELQDAMTKTHVHPALEGGCTSCHNPHGSANLRLLLEEGNKLCFECHSEISDTLEKAKVVHAPVEESCTSCHLPHAADHAKLLLEVGKALCLQCHDSVVTQKMVVLHEPVKSGDCIVCHDPHGSQNEKLLALNFPASQYVPYKDTEYELCFSCHDRDLLQYPETSFATNFRNGERNLHYLHVNNNVKGRSCKLCHDVHGSEHPRMIHKSVTFGKWKLPLNFVKTETGGSCAPGCHKPYSYDKSE